MPEIKDWIYYGLSFIGIMVTGVFSFMLWKVSKVSAEATKKMVEIEEHLYVRELSKPLRLDK